MATAVDQPPLSTRMTPCKICGAAPVPYGNVDFNKSCEDRHAPVMPVSGIAVPYQRCSRCGFIYTNAFDAWSAQDFKAHIYNDDYPKVDPDYGGTRAAFNTQRLCELFPRRDSIDVLDYGGGEGYLAAMLSLQGVRSRANYDPFVEVFSRLPDRRFNLVTSFETFEHLPDPVAGVEKIAQCVEEVGLVVFSTLVQGGHSEKDGAAWWYIAPRNGHVSIYSPLSLTLLWKRFGFQFGSFDANLHAAWRTIPDFAAHILKKP